MTIRVHVLELDLSSLSSVYQCIEQFKGNLLYSIYRGTFAIVIDKVIFIITNHDHDHVHIVSNANNNDVNYVYNLVYFSITIILNLSFQATVTHSLEQCR